MWKQTVEEKYGFRLRGVLRWLLKIWTFIDTKTERRLKISNWNVKWGKLSVRR